MTRVSLLDLIRSGRDLETGMELEIHYPADGHERLSAIEQKHFWFTQRRELILRLLQKFVSGGKQPTNPRMEPVGMDLGCGSGFTAVWMTEHGFPTCGQDVYRGFAGFQRERRGIGFLQGDVTKIEPLPEFDFVLLLDVIEHIPDDRGFVDHVGRMLKPGGVLVLTVPAFAWLWSKVDDSSGHLRRYVRGDLAAFTELPGTRFSVEFASYYFGSTLPLYFVSRMAARLRRSPQGGASAAELTPNPLLNSVLEMLLRLETRIALTVGVSVGSSLVAVLRKNGPPETVGTFPAGNPDAASTVAART